MGNKERMSNFEPTEDTLYLAHEGDTWDRFVMTSSNENSFRVAGPLWGESTGHRRIPLTEASDADLWCFL